MHILPYLLRLLADSPFLAHKCAYWTCGILHRDISPNNILLMNCPDFDGGLLIDWDLCKKVDPQKLAGGARQFTCTVLSFRSIYLAQFLRGIDL